MKMQLQKRDDGQWQADVWTSDGEDHHAIGSEPWEALIRLGDYWRMRTACAQRAKRASDTTYKGQH